MQARSENRSELLGIEAPWEVSKVTHIKESRTAQMHVVCTDDALMCPVCGNLCPGYDRRHREWRHLNICAYRTTVVADLPRVQCPEHGVKTISVPWAALKARFTKEFEGQVIDDLKDMNISAVSDRMGMSWHAVGRIIERAVERGLHEGQDKMNS